MSRQPAPQSVDWAAVGAEVAGQVGRHRAAGRGHLLTEDTVRLCTVLALEQAGVAPGRIAIEALAPELAGGKLDLTVDGLTGTVIELKYPRASPTGISPDTMTFGELLRDFLRVAVVPAADRWVVQVLEHRLWDYLNRRVDVRLMWRARERFVISREALEGLPKTARDAIGSTSWLLPIGAECVAAHPVDVDLALFTYRVDPPAADAVAATLAMGSSEETHSGVSQPGCTATPDGPSHALPTRPLRGARQEILETIASLTTRSGNDVVTVQQVVDELRRNGTRYAASTIRTMISSRLCAQVQGVGVDSHEDLDRVGRGLYRLRPPPDSGASGNRPM